MRYDDPRLRFASKLKLSPKLLFSVDSMFARVLATDFADKRLTGTRLETLGQVITCVLGLKGTHQDGLRAELQSLAGTRLGRGDLYSWFVRLAGNISHIRQGRAVPPWRRHDYGEWTALRVLSASRSMSASGKIDMLFRAYTGSAASFVLSTRWSEQRAAVYSWALFGFTQPSNRRYKPMPMPFTHPRELFNLWVIGHIDPDLSFEAPKLGSAFETNSHLRSANLQILKGRFRATFNGPCPLSLPVTTACFECSAGLDKCSNACRDKSEGERCG